MKEFLLEYIRYNQWANQRLTQFVLSNCSTEQAEHELKSSFPSLKKTFLHIWAAESIWLQRMRGDTAITWKGSHFDGSLTDLCKEISDNNKEFLSFAESCGEAFLLSPLTYKNLEGKEFTNSLAETVLHCVNHSTYHRGQIITLLHQLNFTKLLSTDYINYCRER